MEWVQYTKTKQYTVCIKREKMEPHIAQLDKQIQETDTVKSLHSRDEEIVKDLEDLKGGQASLNSKVDIGFEKGRKRMDGIEADMKKLTQMFIDRDKKTDAQHTEVMEKITNNEIVKLKKELEDRDRSLEKKDSRVWEASKIALTAIVAIGSTIYLSGIGIK